jgi:hypothetical protein
MPKSEILLAAAEVRKDSDGRPSRAGLKVPLFLVVLGFLLRFGNAAFRFLNADEALHYLLSAHPSLAAAYKASLTTVHPPLLIIFLHYWGMLGHSELFLRLPSVLAGTAFCWIMFVWLKRVTNYQTALIGLCLFLFSPALIQLSSEVRQYSLLLLFCATALYFLDRAFEESFLGAVIASGLAIYLALLTHYSSLFFALTLGLYALGRMAATRPRTSIVTAWIIVQCGAGALLWTLFRTHLSHLRQNDALAGVIDTYLRRSVPKPGENALAFISRATVRLFDYFFSQGAVGVIALVMFIVALMLLIRARNPRPLQPQRPAARELAFLLLFPLVLNWTLALFRSYPYGGTRHNAYLAIFVIPGIAMFLSRWHPRRSWLRPVVLAATLTLCNLFPSPTGEYIRLRDQNRRLMLQATVTLHALPADSIIFTDDQGGLLLSYYLCGSKVVQIEEPVFQPFMQTRCGEQWVISLDPDFWIFRANTFADTLGRAQQTYALTPGTPLWFFQAGWFIDKEAPLRQELAGYGCAEPQQFGANITLCQIRVP